MKIIFLTILVICSFLKASEQQLYSYKLFNNQFQAVFPDEPQKKSVANVLTKEEFISKIPPEYQNQLSNKKLNEIYENVMESSYAYIYLDTKNKISYVASSGLSNTSHENYQWDGIKADIDKVIKDSASAEGMKIVKFDSKLFKKSDKYIAHYSYFHSVEGTVMYHDVKQIYFKDKMFRWSVGSPNPNNNQIFDTYQQYVDVLQ